MVPSKNVFKALKMKLLDLSSMEYLESPKDVREKEEKERKRKEKGGERESLTGWEGEGEEREYEAS